MSTAGVVCRWKNSFPLEIPKQLLYNKTLLPYCLKYNYKRSQCGISLKKLYGMLNGRCFNKLILGISAAVIIKVIFERVEMSSFNCINFISANRKKYVNCTPYTFLYCHVPPHQYKQVIRV